MKLLIIFAVLAAALSGPIPRNDGTVPELVGDGPNTDGALPDIDGAGPDKAGHVGDAIGTTQDSRVSEEHWEMKQDPEISENKPCAYDGTKCRLPDGTCAQVEDEGPWIAKDLASCTNDKAEIGMPTPAKKAPWEIYAAKKAAKKAAAQAKAKAQMKTDPEISDYKTSEKNKAAEEDKAYSVPDHEGDAIVHEVEHQDEVSPEDDDSKSCSYDGSECKLPDGSCTKVHAENGPWISQDLVSCTNNKADRGEQPDVKITRIGGGNGVTAKHPEDPEAAPKFL